MQNALGFDDDNDPLDLVADLVNSLVVSPVIAVKGAGSRVFCSG